MKQFTTLQLFNIIDGRLATTMEDVYTILNHIYNTSLMTHQLPAALEYLQLKQPKWYIEEKACLEELKTILGTNDFESLIIALDMKPRTVDIPQLRDEVDVTDFGEFIVNNLFKLSTHHHNKL